MLILRPGIVSMARQVRGGSRPLVRRGSRGTSSSSNPPKPPASSKTAAVIVAATIVAGSACYYTYVSRSSNSNNEKHQALTKRHERYQSSPQHRHRLAAYLVSPANRAIITQRVNTLVNVPGLGEYTEGMIIRKAVDQYMDALEQIVVGEEALPALLVGGGEPLATNTNNTHNDKDDDLLQAEAFELTQAIDTEGTDTRQQQQQQKQAKDELVEKINARVDIYGLSEAQEAVLIRGVVNQLFVLYPGIQRLL